jgi:hypothetical protein
MKVRTSALMMVLNFEPAMRTPLFASDHSQPERKNSFLYSRMRLIFYQ